MFHFLVKCVTILTWRASVDSRKSLLGCGVVGRLFRVGSCDYYDNFLFSLLVTCCGVWMTRTLPFLLIGLYSNGKYWYVGRIVLCYLITVENITTFRAPQVTHVKREFLTHHGVKHVHHWSVWMRAESGSRKYSGGSCAVCCCTGVALGLPLGYFPRWGKVHASVSYWRAPT